jgi:hypothetical protein
MTITLIFAYLRVLIHNQAILLRILMRFLVPWAPKGPTWEDDIRPCNPPSNLSFLTVAPPLMLVEPYSLPLSMDQLHATITYSKSRPANISDKRRFIVRNTAAPGYDQFDSSNLPFFPIVIYQPSPARMVHHCFNHGNSRPFYIFNGTRNRHLLRVINTNID